MPSSPPAMSRTDVAPGPALARLLIGGFREMVDLATSELTKRGHPDVRANHEFAMRAIEAGAGSAAELAGRLGTTKQAAAKTIATLEARGYVAREVDPADARRKSLLLTPHGHDMLAQGQAILDDVRRIWAERIGEERFAETENVLRELFGGPAEVLDAAAWLGRETDQDRPSHKRTSMGKPESALDHAPDAASLSQNRRARWRNGKASE